MLKRFVNWLRGKRVSSGGDGRDGIAVTAGGGVAYGGKGGKGSVGRASAFRKSRRSRARQSPRYQPDRSLREFHEVEAVVLSISPA